MCKYYDLCKELHPDEECKDDCEHYEAFLQGEDSYLDYAD